ncbi:hypothetical protein OG225_17595 [Nocardia sp. NBC_01377]|uniref:hypothetical protein n=1 Tax=Nocardia sp. NBC_01377 TaxID=2903595 RepID=UPI003254D6C9
MSVWAIRCPCGLELVADDEKALLDLVTAHLGERHPQLVGAYEDEDILSIAYRKPSSPAVPGSTRAQLFS